MKGKTSGMQKTCTKGSFMQQVEKQADPGSPKKNNQPLHSVMGKSFCYKHYATRR